MISAESIKNKLKNLAIKENSTMQNELILYGLERSIYRLSISKYADRFTLKGGIFLYALFDRNFTRATQDIDLLANKINNEADNLVLPGYTCNNHYFCCVRLSLTLFFENYKFLFYQILRISSLDYVKLSYL